MQRKAYSAGAVKLGFWFSEFRTVAEQLDSGKSMDEIRTMSEEENIFLCPTKARAEQVWHTVSARVRAVDEGFYRDFLKSDLASQKLFVLATLMACDSLFFDFVYEVIRDKLIMGCDELSDAEIRVFFKNKQQQDDKAAGWTDATLKRLGTAYKTFLYEAGLIDKSKPDRKIIPPLLDPFLERWMLDHGMGPYVKAITGVR